MSPLERAIATQIDPNVEIASRPPHNPRPMTQLGIDIGGTSVKLAAIDGASSRTLWTGQSAFYSRPTTEQLIDAIRMTAAGRVTTADVAGLCVPGLYDKEQRMITLSVNVPGLMGIKLDNLIARALGAGIRQ